MSDYKKYALILIIFGALLVVTCIFGYANDHPIINGLVERIPKSKTMQSTSDDGTTNIITDHSNSSITDYLLLMGTNTTQLLESKSNNTKRSITFYFLMGLECTGSVCVSFICFF